MSLDHLTRTKRRVIEKIENNEPLTRKEQEIADEMEDEDRDAYDAELAAEAEAEENEIEYDE